KSPLPNPDLHFFPTRRSSDLLAKRLGVVTTAHCENADLVLQMQKKFLAEGKTGPEWHHESRPPRVEAEGVHHLLTFAEMLEAHVDRKSTRLNSSHVAISYAVF